jgi:NADPH-dependent 2,4-dienoyl-CoA reductase/sulfur reductase-like enzyme/nitrite reductase/ring-hydroxylating ferredoxin subunit
MSFKEIAKKTDLKNGEMKSYKLDENNNVLLCRINDEFFAVGAACTHYGASLEEGILKDDTIICPLHHACFNAKNGDLLEPPAMDALPNYELQIEGDLIKIKVPEEIPFSRNPDMVKKDIKKDERTFVILGAGASAFFAAQSMRENGFKGNIVMVTRENKTPYDRPNLSKDYLSGNAQPEWMPLRPDDFYEENGIQILKEINIKGVDFKGKNVSFDNGENLKYDKLLIATGGVPRKLNIPGAGLNNIFYLRTFNDADNIIEAAKNAKRAVVIGAGFIAMETAHSLTERNIKVTIVAPGEVPFERNFGKEIGNLIKKEHEKEGTIFKFKSTVKEFKGNVNVKSVLLESGEEIETDFVVIGIGVKPATGFLSGIDLLDDGSFKTDSNLKVTEDVYAAGDIATFPEPHTGNLIRVEHWRLAMQLGRIAGANMAGKKVFYDDVPYFWTEQAGISLRYVGFVKKWDEIIIDGNIHKKDFIAYYIKDNFIHAAAGVNRDKEIDIIHLLIKKQRFPEVEALRDNSVNIFNLI